MNDDSDNANNDNTDDTSHSSTRDKTFEHREMILQPIDGIDVESGDNVGAQVSDVELLHGTMEMPESEIEPPTVGSQVSDVDESDSASSSDTLDEPRDEVELTGEGTFAEPNAPDEPEMTDAASDETRTPFHADSIHESNQPSLKSADSSVDGELNTSEPTPDTGAPSVSSMEAPALSTEPPTEAMPGANDLLENSDSIADIPASSTDSERTSRKRGGKKKKYTIIAIVIALVVALLIGGAAFAYKGWYQVPDKVLSDAMMNFVGAKSMTYSGTLDYGNDNAKLNIVYSGSVSGGAASAHIATKLTNDGKVFEIPVDIISQKSTVYFKLSNLKKLETQILTPLLAGNDPTGTTQKRIDTLVQSIDGTWYKIAPDDLNTTAKDKKIDACVDGVIEKIRTDDATQKELFSVYKSHPLFTIKKDLGLKDGNLGYELSPVSDAKAREFGKALQSTSIYKTMAKCNKDFDAAFTKSLQSDEAQDTSDVPTIKVWVSQWDHQFTKITVNDDALGMTFVPKVGDETGIKVPSGAKSIDDLKKQIMDFMQSNETPKTTNTIQAPVSGMRVGATVE